MGFGETTGLSVLLGGPVIKENFRSCNVFLKLWALSAEFVFENMAFCVALEKEKIL